MAPIAALLAATEARGAKLRVLQAEKKAELDGMDAQIAEKRAEKSIAAQNAVREMLKAKEVLMKEVKNHDSVCSILDKALAKLKRASELGLSDWDALHEETIKLSEFGLKRLKKDSKALENLKKSCGASLVLKETSLQFTGAREAVPKLKEALVALEADYEERVEAEDEDTLRLLEQRGELSRIAKKHDVTITKDGSALRVIGPPKGAEPAADLVRGVLSGREDLDVPKALVGAVKATAKEIEAETGALLEVWRTGGWGGGGVVCIRGVDSCVEEAREKMQAWLDQREGATSEFMDVGKEVSEWPEAAVNQLWGDLDMMGQKFGLAVRQREPKKPIELRGSADSVAAATKEFKMILDFYKAEQVKQKAQAKAKAAAAAKAAEQAKKKAEEDDGWGAAPMAEPTPSSWN